MHHDLKACVESFNRMALKVSPVQLRRNDRGFAVGDTCTFYEWLPSGKCGGRCITKVPVVEVFDGEGLAVGWCLIVLKLPDTEIGRWVPGVCGCTKLPVEGVPAAAV